MTDVHKIQRQKSLAGPEARDLAAGFLLAGMLIGVLGSLMIAWLYQFDKDFREVGLHFLAFSGAALAGAFLVQRFLRAMSFRWICMLACVLASVAYIELTFAWPAVPVVFRLLGVALLGAASGVLIVTLLHASKPYYDQNAAGTINFAGILAGCGSFLVTLTVGGTYYLYSVQWETILLAAVPLVFLILFSRSGQLRAGTFQPQQARSKILKSALSDVSSVAAVLFSLLLFFQIGNEWSLAGWLPLFLIHRLGINPESAILVLALYFLALVAGRIISQALLSRVGHTKMLAGSIVAAMLGYLLLSFTNTVVGSALATILTGLAFAPIYALVAEKLGRRFDYRPGFFNGIFSLALTGGMLMPWLLGFVGYYLGMSYVMIVPALGSVAVFILMLLILLESKLMGGNSDKPEPPASKSFASSAGG
jgi:fucose permease